MRRRATKNDEPSAASLAEMPEVDLSKYGKLSRGKHVARARRSLAVLVLDKKIVAAPGGPDAVRTILHVLAQALVGSKKRRAA
ncbi:MAG: hypothetical protein JOZ69_25235 [Myxococcales bacterium]|nr:hypothetical protein [Myxococcales bacterium]